MFNKIIQWNIDGLATHLEFLQKLVNDEKPDIICIQETNFKDQSFIKLKGYEINYKNRTECLRASGGVATYIKSNLNYSNIKVTSKLEAIATSVTIAGKNICICNVYIPDSYNLDNNGIPNLIAQLPKPFIIVGDFNSHNSLWGSHKIDARGKLIDKLLLDQDITLLNTTEPTHFDVVNAKLSAIDLSLCSPGIADQIEWSVCHELYNSDHYPIIISTPNDPRNTPIFKPRWKFKQANWQKYQSFIKANIDLLKDPETADPEEIDDIVEKFMTLINEAAEKSIPKTTREFEKNYVPWWNDECSKAVKDSKQAFNRYKKHPTSIIKPNSS